MASEVKRVSSVPALAGSTPALARSSRASGDPGIGSPSVVGLVVVRVAVIGVSDWVWSNECASGASGAEGLDLVEGFDEFRAAQALDGSGQGGAIDWVAAQQRAQFHNGELIPEGAEVGHAAR